MIRRCPYYSMDHCTCPTLEQCISRQREHLIVVPVSETVAFDPVEQVGGPHTPPPKVP